ncbi:MAG: transcription antitermination factor NusB [Cyanobacteria bacterium P01_E01_bin.6]
MQPRRTARELALLCVSQVPSNPSKLYEKSLQDLVVAAVQTLAVEVRDTIELASVELERGSERLLSSETRVADFNSSKAMVKEAIALTQSAVNRLGAALELPEFVQLGNQPDVRDYTLQILLTVRQYQGELDQILNDAMVDWKLHRLAKIDQDILRIAVAEFLHLGIPKRVAINEAVELAKRYSEEDGHRFINGVLRRVSDRTELKSNPAS